MPRRRRTISRSCPGGSSLMNCGLGRSYDGITLYHPFGPFRPAFRPFRYAIMALIQRNMYDSVRALKDELFKLMAENEELKRRKKLDCFWGEKRLASLSPPTSLLIVLFFIKPTKFVSLYFENHFIRTDLYRCCIHAPCLL